MIEKAMLRQRLYRFLGLVVLAGSVVLTGCTDNRFSSEKLFWQAEQKVNKLVKGKTRESLTKEDFDRIIRVYRRVADKFPLEPLAAKAQFLIIDIYTAQGEYDKAHQELKSIIENFSFQSKIAARAQFAVGKIFEFQGKSREALDEYEKVSDLYPLSSLGLETPLYITQYYKKMKDKPGQKRAHRQAIRHYKKIIGDYADTSIAGVVQNYLVQAYLQREDWSGAIKVWDEIITKYPNTPQAIRGLMAKAEVRAKHLDDLAGAIVIYQECVEKYPQAEFIKEVKLRLGNLYLENSQNSKAQEVFSLLIKDYPQDENLVVRGRFGIVSCLKEEGRKEEAVKEYRDICKSYPDNPSAFSTPYLVYRYYRKIDDIENAKTALDTAISEYEKKFSPVGRDKKNTALSRLLFLCYAEKKDWNKALGLLRTLAGNQPKDPSSLLTMAVIYFKELDDAKEAKKIFREVIDKFSSNKALVKLAKEQIVFLDKQTTKRIQK